MNANQSNPSDNDDEDDTIPLWSIGDTMFHPLGLINHSTGGTRYIFVTWSEDYLLNFVCKASAKTRVRRVDIPNANVYEENNEYTIDDIILRILILEKNTLILMRSGNVFYFSSVKSIHPVSSLTGVRCISPTQNGFCVIRVLPDNTLCLENYQDIANLKSSAPILLKRFDVTFDEQNIFNCQWMDERFTVTAQVIQKDSIKFLEQVIWNECDLSDKEELFFFTVSGSVFALVPGNSKAEAGSDNENFHVQLLNTYASNVEFVKVLCDRGLFLVFLECGTIDIWYSSSMCETLRRQTHYSGTYQYSHYEFCDTNGCFFYTDEEKLARLQFIYDPTTDSCIIKETYKAIPGLLACTWVEAIQKLICLSCNNIFYRVAFDDCQTDCSTALTCNTSATTIEYENLTDLYELTETRLAKLIKKAEIVNEVARAPQILRSAIQEEINKQQLLAIGNKVHVYKKFLKASLEFHTQPPMSNSKDDNNILIYTSGNFEMKCSNIFAVLHVKAIKNDALQLALWNIHINYESKSHTFHVPINILQSAINIVIPLQWESGKFLPNFNVRLISFVNSSTDYVAISLPIDVIVSANAYLNLFTINKCSHLLCSDSDLTEYMDAFNIKKPKTSKPFSYVLHLPTNITFMDIVKVFKTANEKESIKNQYSSMNLYFMSTLIQITHIIKGNCIQLQSEDVLALYYAKLIIYAKIFNTNKLEMHELNENVGLEQIILQYQCEIERCYGTMLGLDEDSTDIPSSPNISHLDNLRRVYERLRTDLCKIFG